VLAAPTPAITGPGTACLRPRGACANVAAAGDIPVGAVASGKSVRGIVKGSSLPLEFIPMLVDQVRLERLPVERMVRRYDFAHINEAAYNFGNGNLDQADPADSRLLAGSTGALSLAGRL
jgi:hypothetical protein